MTGMGLGSPQPNRRLPMPLITVTVSTPHLKVLDKATIAAEVARLSTTLLRKDPKVTAVIVSRVPSDDWFCGGRSLTQEWLASGGRGGRGAGGAGAGGGGAAGGAAA